MSNISVPLPGDMLKAIKTLIKQGVAANMSEFVRHAIKTYLEEQAVQAVLRASKEPNLKGDLDKLAKKL
mgnify:CR=1 FL=1